MWDDLIQILIDAGPVIAAISILILVGAAFEIWVWGYVHRREMQKLEDELTRQCADRDFWRDRALVALGLGEKITEVATTLIEEAS